MKGAFFFVAFLVAGVTGFAQQKTIERAIVQSKTEITFPQNINRNTNSDNDASFGPAGGMESKTTVYFKGDMIKTHSESDFGNTTVIIDKKNKKTTTLTEAMGRKTGFYTTAEDEAAMRQRMDSMRQERGQAANSQFGMGETEVINSNETKKIAGYTCKKAILKTQTRQGGTTSEAIVWYTPDFKMAPGYPAGGNPAGGGFGRGMRGQRGAGFGMVGLDKIDGFVMGYEVKRPNGFEMNMQVTKIELDPVIEDKVFEIPKGYDIKPLKEMQGQFRQSGRRANRDAGNNN